jgi:uncharacterized protein
LGIGFSLGANVLTRYLAEEGENSRLVAGFALGCVSCVILVVVVVKSLTVQSHQPWDLKVNSEKSDSHFPHAH